jgi:hypothetical protein
MWTGGVAQVVEHLPSKHEVLSSNPSTAKKKKKETKKENEVCLCDGILFSHKRKKSCHLWKNTLKHSKPETGRKVLHVLSHMCKLKKSLSK